MDDLKQMIADFEARGGEITRVPTGHRAYTETAMELAVCEPDGQVHHLVTGVQETGEEFAVRVPAINATHARDRVRMQHPEWVITESRPDWVK